MGGKCSKKEPKQQKEIPTLPKHRTITEYPQGYQAWYEPYTDKSPYKNVDFNSRVANAVSQDAIDPDRLKSCKMVLIGDQGAGKTRLVKRFSKDIFEVTQEYQATIATEFEVEQFMILSIPYNTHVWDTAGEKNWKEITLNYCKTADVVLMVFDFSHFSSFQNIEEWKEDADKQVKDPFYFLVGTQKDIVSESVFHDMDELAVKLAQTMGVEYWAVSAKTGERVRDLFARAITLSFEKHVLEQLDKLPDNKGKKTKDKKKGSSVCLCLRPAESDDVSEMYTKKPTGETSKEKPTGETSKEKPTGETSKEKPTGETSKEKPTGETSKEKPTGETSKEKRNGDTSRDKEGEFVALDV